jgi:PDZ domain-containing protein
MWPIETKVYNDLGSVLEAQRYLDLDVLGEDYERVGNSFYFTTVSVFYVNRLGFDWFLKLILEDPYEESFEELNEQNPFDMTTQDFSRLGQYYTRQSMGEIATIAFNLAGRPQAYETYPVIQFAMERYETGQLFQTGDIILSVNGEVVENTEMFMAYRDALDIAEGTTIVIEILRDGEALEVPVTFREQNKVGEYILGILVADTKVFEDNFDPATLVKIGTGFEGDSAGLMLTLELIQVMTGEDLTKGYKIAGTGAVSAEDQQVFEVGDVPLKIKTAHKRHVDIFFVPRYVPLEDFPDYTYEDSNEYQALITAEEIGTQMQIVPVQSVEEALLFLQDLEVRE